MSSSAHVPTHLHAGRLFRAALDLIRKQIPSHDEQGLLVKEMGRGWGGYCKERMARGQSRETSKDHAIKIWVIGGLLEEHLRKIVLGTASTSILADTGGVWQLPHSALLKAHSSGWKYKCVPDNWYSWPPMRRTVAFCPGDL